jgi:hypothetical protein
VRHTFDYAVIRLVPRVERAEFVNAGIVLFCRTLEFLAAGIALDRDRLRALAPGLDPAEAEHHLALFPRVCANGQSAGALGRLSPSERFHWLTQPSSSLIQTSPVHSGLCADPQVALDHLMDTMVRLPALGPSAGRPPPDDGDPSEGPLTARDAGAPDPPAGRS